MGDEQPGGDGGRVVADGLRRGVGVYRAEPVGPSLPLGRLRRTSDVGTGAFRGDAGIAREVPGFVAETDDQLAVEKGRVTAEVIILETAVDRSVGDLSR